MKYIYIYLSILLVLVSCGRPESTQDTQETQIPEAEKTEFFVVTTRGSEFSGESTLKKTWQVSSSQDITITNNTSGRVAQINTQVWQRVNTWQVLVRLDDTISNLDISLERSQNAIDRSQLDYESSKVSFERQIFDARQSVKDLERALVTLEQDSEQSIIQAKENLKNSTTQFSDSTSELQLEQLDNNIEKARFEYDILLENDRQVIVWYGQRLKTDFDALNILLDDVIEFSDEILWVTQLNRFENDRIDDFLGAKDSFQKARVKEDLKDLLDLRWGNDFIIIQQELQQGDIPEERILEVKDFIIQTYERTQDLLNELEITFNNSIKSVGILWDPEIDVFVTQINSFQSQIQRNSETIATFSTTVKSFLATYRENQLSVLKNIELQQKERAVQAAAFKNSDENLQTNEVNAQANFQRTLITVEDNIASLQLQIETAKNNLENIIKTRDVTLKGLLNSIEEARISYKSSQRDIEKLVITSPISGTVSAINIDRGQEIWNGTSIMSIVSDKTPEVEISFSNSERFLVKKWQNVSLSLNGKQLQGTISTISDIADENLNYISTISLQAGTSIIGNIVSVEVPINTDKILLPLNIITTKGNDIWTVKTLSWSTFSDVRVRMWEVFWEYVEIVSCAKNCVDLNIIRSDISNFDENKFKIVEK